MQRCVGDFEYKRNRCLPPEAQIVTAYADVLTQDIVDEDEFIILGCDGIWERRSSQEVIDFVKPRLDICRQRGQSISAVAGRLLDAIVSPDVALTNGLGCDNMTCIIVDLARWTSRGLSLDVPLLGASLTVSEVPQGIVHAPDKACSILHRTVRGGLVVSLASLLVIALVGWVVGLLISVATAVAGVVFCALLAILLQCYFLAFHRVCSKLDSAGVVVAGLAWLAFNCFWLSVSCCSARLAHSSVRHIVFGGAGVLLGEAIYTYANMYCLEDERKHLLVRCGPLITAPCTVWTASERAEKPAYGEALRSLAWWLQEVVAARFWSDFVAAAPMKADEEASAAGGITVHNLTLKQIKVCLYASDDRFCWIPLGGVAGSCVGFVPAEQSRSFSFEKCGADAVSSYRLKVFRPAILDVELAIQSDVRRGDAFVLYDAEQMIKRTSAAPQPSSPPLLLDGVSRRSGPRLPVRSATQPRRDPGPDEVVLRNRSQRDIRALIFSANDHINWIPLVGKMAACGDCILPDRDRWFNLGESTAHEFTLKIYDAEAGAGELTYLTVARGQAYTFSDSLLA